MDQFHDQHGLADACAAKHRGLTTLGDRRQQVDSLDAGSKNLGRAGLRGKRRGLAVDGPPRNIRRQGAGLVAYLPGDIEKTAKNGVADRDDDRATYHCNLVPSPHRPRGLERDRANVVFVKMRLHFGHDRSFSLSVEDQYGIFYWRQAIGESNVDHGAAHRYDVSGMLTVLVHLQSSRSSIPEAGSSTRIYQVATSALRQRGTDEMSMSAMDASQGA